MSVGRVAGAVGLSIDTLRYYEREGLMWPVSRAPNGHRRYAESDLGWIALLKCLPRRACPSGKVAGSRTSWGRGSARWRGGARSR